tara:strand:- start:572 stop:907 length:336 start_codon:yes stop_codon:yes gene_type:complete
MIAKNIIDQIEKMFGRQPEQYMFQLINDALDEISSKKMNNTESKTTDLIGHDRWYTLTDEMIQIERVEIKDTNNRYVMIPKLADPHKLLRSDTDDTATNWVDTDAGDDTLT